MGETPMGPNVADMAHRRDTEYEILHRLRVHFRCNDLSILSDKGKLNTKIRVSSIDERGEKEEIDSTEIVQDSLHPSWRSHIVIDYRIGNSEDYLAELVNTAADGFQKVLGETCFKLPELITSKGEFVQKELNCHGLIVDEDANEPQQPVIGIMGVEEKDVERDALEFSLQVYNLPKKIETASFFQIHRQVKGEEFELVYESKYQNPVEKSLNFDETSIFVSKMKTASPDLKCRLELFTCQKKGVFERSTAKHLGTVTFSFDDMIEDYD